ncbi:acyltransferase family protein [Paenibacillus sp. URB8-2]|uniref:acyltransferase family protein n=1 Tax=Paenibacillus sp. URB8-2 TaxID=2741301 RepID=UPI0015BE26EC|nr:acyltransferase family protein [Paenibacillus sp. URB8-2]BCG58867.1 hypothetical protein PUR_22920 [Paenibacillus sp. URB8-2]
MEKKYDYSLDAMKGFSCLLMIMAHTGLVFSGSSRSFQIIGELAPVLFFAVSGITSIFQSKKNVLPLLAFYFVFAVIGLSYNALWRPYIWSDPVSDVPQIVAMSVLGIILLEKYFRPGRYVYLILAVFLFTLHYVFTAKVPSFPGKQFFIPEGDYTYFTFVPWFSIFLLGVFAYRSSKRINLISGILAACFLAGAYFLTPRDTEFLVKYNMSPGYFFLSLVLLFMSFSLFRSIRQYSLMNPLLFFGKHSFLFLYVHVFIIFILTHLKLYSINVYIIWAAVLLASYIGMNAVLWINKYVEALFNYKLVWLGLLMLILSVPAVVDSFGLIVTAEAALGMAFACNYKKLSQILTPIFTFAPKSRNLQPGVGAEVAWPSGKRSFPVAVTQPEHSDTAGISGPVRSLEDV